MAEYSFRRLPGARIPPGRHRMAWVDILDKSGQVVIPSIPLRLALLTYGRRPFVSLVVTDRG